jgi:CRP/FNR family transcriptional regulator, polysaccharide utilization system transcription regulator
MNSIECLLPTYEVLTDDQIRKINDSSYIVKHHKSENIFSQDKPKSHLMFLSSGLIKIFKKDQNNKSIILKIAGPGNYIGLISVFYGDRYQFSAIAIEDSELVYISISVILEILADNGSFAVQMIKQFSDEGMELLNKLIYFPQKQVPGRVAEVLLFFSGKIYLNDQFTLPLSRQELADLVYSTKESVSRTLNEFKNDRIIDFTDRLITLKSIELLKILSKVG